MPKQYEANCFVSTRNSSVMQCTQTFGDKACHPERSEGSRSPDEEILPLRFTQGFGSLRSELALEHSEGMTGRTPLKSAHGKPSLHTFVTTRSSCIHCTKYMSSRLF